MDLKSRFEMQQEFFNSGTTLNVDARKVALKSLGKMLSKYQDQILYALSQDLGRDPKDSYVLELGQVYEEINTQLHHMRWWSLTKPHYTPIPLLPAISTTTPNPYGNALIISPWNYPLQLALCPLVDAIAAGNTVMLKPSEQSSHTADIIEMICEEAFEPEYVTVVRGSHDVANELLDMDFDIIFFTGSQEVGKHVMKKAAEHLAPVVLELGGKSPAIVDLSANLALAAKRIVWGKFINAGQTCVAPDYVLVHESVLEPFLAQLKHEIDLQYPQPETIGKIISKRHFDRLVSLIAASSVYYGGKASESTLQITPTIVYPCAFGDAIMQEEIFGPILPVLVFRDFYELGKVLKELPTPLASYLFTRDPIKKDYFRKNLEFGGGCLNDVVLHVANNHLPFGGLKNSGLGEYHGKTGFNVFSHQKSIYSKGEWELPVRYATFDERLQSWLYKFFYHL